MVARMVWLVVLGVAWAGSPVAAQEEVADKPGEVDPAETNPLLPIEAIRQKLLATDVEINLIETPLLEAAAFWEQTLGLPIHIDRPALEDVGLKLHTPVSLQLKTKARTALRLMLKELDLAYVTQPGRLVITTPEEAEVELRTVFYPVADLVFPPGTQPESGFLPDYDTLMEIITTTIHPESWEELGGPGPISAYRGGILISQTDEIHDAIEHLLQVLREVKSLKANDSQEPRHASPTAQAEAAVQRKMTEARVTLTLEETPLVDLLQMLGDKLEIPVHIERRALEDIGETPDLALTGQWTQMPPATVLKDVLHAHNLTWYVTGEVLVITIYEEAESELITKVYPVGDLAPKSNDSTLEAPRYAYSYSYIDGRPYEDLIAAVTSQVEPDSWEELDGPGTIAPYDDVNALIVSQTHEVHQKLNDLLRQIREKSVSFDAPPADGEEAKTDGKPVTFTYQAHAVEGKPQSTPEDLAKVARRMAKVIAPDTWQDEAHYIEVLSDRLIVSQTPEVHRAVEEYLHQTGIIADHHAFSPHGFGPSAGSYATDGVYPEGGSGIWPSCHGIPLKMLPKPEETGPETAQPTEAQPQPGEPNNSVLNPKEPRPADPSSEFDPFADPPTPTEGGIF